MSPFGHPKLKHGIQISFKQTNKIIQSIINISKSNNKSNIGGMQMINQESATFTLIGLIIYFKR